MSNSVIVSSIELDEHVALHTEAQRVEILLFEVNNFLERRRGEVQGQLFIAGELLNLVQFQLGDDVVHFGVFEFWFDPLLFALRNINSFVDGEVSDLSEVHLFAWSGHIVFDAVIYLDDFHVSSWSFASFGYAVFDCIVQKSFLLCHTDELLIVGEQMHLRFIIVFWQVCALFSTQWLVNEFHALNVVIGIVLLEHILTVACK